VLFTFPTWVAAGLVLAVSLAQATPPLDCVENEAGKRYCVRSGMHFMRTPPKPDIPIVAAPHPATIKTPYALYQPSGRQVDRIPTDQFLPGYFEPRNVEYSPYAKKSAVSSLDSTQAVVLPVVQILPASVPLSLSATEGPKK